MFFNPPGTEPGLGWALVPGYLCNSSARMLPRIPEKKYYNKHLCMQRSLTFSLSPAPIDQNLIPVLSRPKTTSNRNRACRTPGNGTSAARHNARPVITHYRALSISASVCHCQFPGIDTRSSRKTNHGTHRTNGPAAGKVPSLAKLKAVH